MVLKSWLMSGDVFVLLKWSEPTQFNPYALRLHVIEADRISTPHAYGSTLTIGGYTEGRVPEGKPGAGNKIYDGVEVDADGRVVAYYISNTYPRQITADKQEWTRVKSLQRAYRSAQHPAHHGRREARPVPGRYPILRRSSNPCCSSGAIPRAN